MERRRIGFVRERAGGAKWDFKESVNGKGNGYKDREGTEALRIKKSIKQTMSTPTLVDYWSFPSLPFPRFSLPHWWTNPTSRLTPKFCVALLAFIEDVILLRKLRNRQMVGAIENCYPSWVSLTQGFPLRTSNSNPRICFPRKFPNPSVSQLYHSNSFSLLSTFPLLRLSPEKHSESLFPLPLKASSSPASVGSEEFTEEPGTKVKFQTQLVLPGYSSSFCLLGTGYREKVFAIIGVKVYAAGLYVNQSILDELKARKGPQPAEVQDDSSLFKSIFQSPSAKSLKIVLVREVDGKTFWDALDEAVSPRINAPTPIDSSALSTFRKIFEGRPLKKGTFIFLTWIQPSKMIVSVSGEGLPVGVDATIESTNVSFALFDVFFGETPVSPTLKASAADGLAKNII